VSVKKNTTEKTVLSTHRDLRQKFATLALPQSSSQRPKTASRQAFDKLLKSSLASAGFDVKKLEALKKKNDAEVRNWLTKRRAEADKLTSSMQKTMQQSIENWRASLLGPKGLAVPPPATSQVFLLMTATDISATSGIALAGSNIGPQNNWVEFQLESTDSSTQEVTFVFSWQNTADKYAVINVDGYIAFNGVCEAIANGGFLPGDRHSYVDLYGILELNVSESPIAPNIFAASQSVLSLHADGGGWFSDGQILYQQLFRGFDLHYDTLVVPPQQVVTIDVSGRMTYSNSDGMSNYVFTTMGRQIYSPLVIVSVVS
jgi:hypothetical protein